MKSKTSLLPLSLLLLSLATPALAQKKGEPTDEPKAERCAVVKVDDEYRVIPSDEVSKLKEQLKEEHKAALAEYKEAVKAAKEKGEKLDLKAPKAKKLKVVKPSLDEAEAKELIAKLEEKAAGKERGSDKKARTGDGKKEPSGDTPAKKEKADKKAKPAKKAKKAKKEKNG